MQIDVITPNPQQALDEQTLTFLLPLSKENITSYLSIQFSLFSFKTTDLLTLFISQFNQLTNNEYANDFQSFLTGEQSFLSSTNLVIPIKLIIKKQEFDKYMIQTLICLMPLKRSLFSSFCNFNMVSLYKWMSLTYVTWLSFYRIVNFEQHFLTFYCNLFAPLHYRLIRYNLIQRIRSHYFN